MDNNNHQITSEEIINENLNKESHVCSSICPSLQFLKNEKIITNVSCIVPNCDEIFLNQSNLNFHLEKVHKIKLEKQTNELILTRARSKSQKIQDNCSCKYYCPVVNCKFYNGSDRYLPTFHSLKNHFIRMHGEKSYPCSKCKKAFSIKSEMERHEGSCGVVFKCSCGCPYASRLSLLKHARKKNHEIIDESSKNDHSNSIPPQKSKSRQNSINTDNKPNISKNIKILPAQTILSQSNDLPQFFLIPVTLNSTSQSKAETLSSLISNHQDIVNQNVGCQTKLQDSNNETQEIACQTIYNNLIEVTKTVSQQCDQIQRSFNDEPSYFTNASTSTHDNLNDPFINYQSQNTQTIIENDDYMNMIIADISTQTQLSSFSNAVNSLDHNIELQLTESREIQTSEIVSNTACTQTSISSYLNEVHNNRSESIGLNLEFSSFGDQHVYFSSEDIIQNNTNTISTNTNNDFHVGTQFSNGINLNSVTPFHGVASSCQTDELSFTDNFANTNSIQTQTQTSQVNFYSDINEIDSMTQTDHNRIFSLDRRL